MADLNSNCQLLTEEQSKQLAEKHLFSRYHELQKITFTAIEVVSVDTMVIHKLFGTVKFKTRNLLERSGVFANASTFKCVVDVNASSRKVINFEFQ